MRAALEQVFGSDSFEGKHVLLQGVGAVGGGLAELLHERGAHVTICDINEERVAELCKRYGFDAIADEHHLEVECDVYAPCARGAGLNADTIPVLRCKIVAGCANNQLLDPAQARDVRARGILYVPDYVLNAGGIINVSCELLEGGYNEAVAKERIERIYDNLKQVFEISDREDIPTNEASQRLAEERIRAAKTA